MLVVLLIVAVLVAAALVAVFVRGATPQFDANSPEGVVQRYVTATIQGDFESARELHAMSHSIEGCDPVTAFVAADTRMTLVSGNQSNATATVTVRITDGYGGPFGGDNGYEDRFELAKSGDSWLVTTTPWQFQVCIEEVVR